MPEVGAGVHKPRASWHGSHRGSRLHEYGQRRTYALHCGGSSDATQLLGLLFEGQLHERHEPLAAGCTDSHSLYLSLHGLCGQVHLGNL